ncbi:MAG: hypothetical protein KUF77_09540 [Candidatus Thiodiazotropha sp. (ex Lucina aurantia)]|nr:hypothetical protein [Candidatus Thiodiazotropha sp. (ex Lucina pensylvanica)]MBT3022002.1 hypothetical protein [Candidatus Thiodiazotropha taylori]MBT3041275.1 hypothetical protein [Candidatus Thiodiazotropha sp. (ex Codakia orbicularis)]MBV2103251.1 hypothetical protein [Candidatus Thiodiazotropha sp. (ex Lucina aurantia)]MBT3029817.1 hypothetical protein [Candidatus Thiodiazotropha sp. (ex Lucina pensylvanica)]
MISQQQLQEIGAWLGSQPIASDVDQQLRKRYGDIHFTYCMDDDVIGARPVYEHAGFNLYLVDSSNHCLSITQDMAVASGLVVAEIEDV